MVMSQALSLVLIAVVLIAMAAYYWWRVRPRRRLELMAVVCVAGCTYACTWAVIEGVGWLYTAGGALFAVACGLRLLQWRREGRL